MAEPIHIDNTLLVTLQHAVAEKLVRLLNTEEGLFRFSSTDLEEQWDDLAAATSEILAAVVDTLVNNGIGIVAEQAAPNRAAADSRLGRQFAEEAASYLRPEGTNMAQALRERAKRSTPRGELPNAQAD